MSRDTHPQERIAGFFSAGLALAEAASRGVLGLHGPRRAQTARGGTKHSLRLWRPVESDCGETARRLQGGGVSVHARALGAGSQALPAATRAMPQGRGRPTQAVQGHPVRVR